MNQNNVQLVVPFDALANLVSALSLPDKQRLWALLEEQLTQAEEALWEQDSAFQAEIKEARAAYNAGDYMTIDEYVAQQKD